MPKTLRIQFMDHMTLNRFSPWTIKNYMDTMTRLAKYYNKSPDLISQDEIQEYLLYLFQKRKLSWGTCNTHLSGLACFYKTALKWDERKFKLPPRPRVKKLPNVLSVEEVKDFLNQLLILNTVFYSRRFTALALESEEKLRMIDALWADLVSEEELLESPEWHKKVLKRTEQRFAEGKERILDWQTAKKELRKHFE